MLGQVFGQPLRQTEGFVRSILALMGCDLPVPDHSTLARRRRCVEVAHETSTNQRPTDIALDSTGLKFFGAPFGIMLRMTLPGNEPSGARQKHGKTRRSWRKLHISVDPKTSEIRAHALTDDTTADRAMAGPLVKVSGGQIKRIFAPLAILLRNTLSGNGWSGIAKLTSAS